jgi:hypothetical protein
MLCRPYTAGLASLITAATSSRSSADIALETTKHTLRICLCIGSRSVVRSGAHNHDRQSQNAEGTEMKKQRNFSRRGFIQTGMAGVGAMAAAGAGVNSFGQAPAIRTASGYPVLDTVDVLIVGGRPALGQRSGRPAQVPRLCWSRPIHFSAVWLRGCWEWRSTRCVPAESPGH